MEFIVALHPKINPGYNASFFPGVKIYSIMEMSLIIWTAVTAVVLIIFAAPLLRSLFHPHHKERVSSHTGRHRLITFGTESEELWTPGDRFLSSRKYEDLNDDCDD